VAYGILFLRAIVGLLLFLHGTQKLFGWWGGPGPRGAAGFFAQLGFRPPTPMAIVAGLSEASGLLFALGFLTPFAALAMASVMVVATGSVHWRNGLFATNGGFELPLMFWTVAVSIAAIGPGRFSIDRALGWDDNLSGTWWGVGVGVASIVGGAFVLLNRIPASQRPSMGGPPAAPAADPPPAQPTS
jgi:putative oxidoreductase